MIQVYHTNSGTERVTILISLKVQIAPKTENRGGGRRGFGGATAPPMVHAISSCKRFDNFSPLQLLNYFFKKIVTF